MNLLKFDKKNVLNKNSKSFCTLLYIFFYFYIKYSSSKDYRIEKL